MKNDSWWRLLRKGQRPKGLKQANRSQAKPGETANQALNNA